MTKKIWFGNAEKMMWVNCPSTNIRRGRGKWEESGMYLNGGAYQKSSAYSHRKYSIDWNLMESYEAAKIMSYYEGVYGQSPIFFVDPFAAKSNILPLHWSVPRLCVNGEAPTLGVTGAAVTETTTLYNTIPGTPTRSAVFSLPAFASGKTVTVPVPPGYALHFGYSASATCVQVNGVSVAPSATDLFTYTVDNSAGAGNLNVVFRVGLASAGTAAINRMSAIVSKTPPAKVFRNLIPNPSFEVGTTGPIAGPGISYLITAPGETPAGINRLSVFGSNPAQQWSLNYLATTLDYTPVAGQWVAFSARVRRSGSVGLHLSLALQFRSGTTQVSATPFAFVPLTADSLLAPSTLYTVVAQVPSGVDNARVLMNFGGTSSGGTPVDGWLAHTDAWIACAASTQAAALAQVATYFDGDTAPPGNISVWDGTPNASTSTMYPVGTSINMVEFRQGEGNTGLRFAGEPTRTGYSSVLDLESVSAEFVEVGAWE